MVDSAGKAAAGQGGQPRPAVSAHARERLGWSPNRHGVRAERVPRQGARGQEQLAVSCWCLVFRRNPILGDFLSDNLDLIASSSFLHDRGAGKAARVRTIARTTSMLHSEKRRALDTNHTATVSNLSSDTVAVWRMTKGSVSPGNEHIIGGDLE